MFGFKRWMLCRVLLTLQPWQPTRKEAGVASPCLSALSHYVSSQFCMRLSSSSVECTHFVASVMPLSTHGYCTFQVIRGVGGWKKCSSTSSRSAQVLELSLVQGVAVGLILNPVFFFLFFLFFFIFSIPWNPSRRWMTSSVLMGFYAQLHPGYPPILEFQGTVFTVDIQIVDFHHSLICGPRGRPRNLNWNF